MQSLSNRKVQDYLKGLVIPYVAITLLVFGCTDSTDDADINPINEPEVNWRETHTISELKDSYAAGNVIEDTVIFTGKVSSSNTSGNFSKIVYLQSSEAIAIPLAVENLSDDYELGKEFLVLASGLKYDLATNTLVTDDGELLSSEEAGEHFYVIDSNRTVNFKVVTDLMDIEASDDSRLVKIYGIQFEESLTDENYNEVASSGRLNLKDKNGNEITLQIVPEATLSDLSIPYESGSIEGIVKLEGEKKVIIPRTPEDLDFTRERHSMYAKAVFSANGNSLPYQIMFPRNYNAQEEYPLVIFLHGAGERGTDNERQMAYGSQTFSSQYSRENHPAIVVFPQCPNTDMWSRRTKETIDGELIFEFPVETSANTPMQLVIDLTNELVATEAVDESRIYVMGLSMGGIGTLEYLYYASDIPAAAISIAGGHDADLVQTYGEKVSIRLYHGGNDGVVPPRYSENLFTALDALSGADVEFYLDENKGHEWNYVLNEAENLLPWLWSKTK